MLSNIVSLGKIKLTALASKPHVLIPTYTDFSDSAAGQRAQTGL